MFGQMNKQEKDTENRSLKARYELEEKQTRKYGVNSPANAHESIITTKLQGSGDISKETSPLKSQANRFQT